MNYKEIENSLKEYKSSKVLVYINYLKKIESQVDRQGRKKNVWFSKFTAKNYSDIYEKVAIDDPLYIDGVTITLTNVGGLNASYGYQSYKNKILINYPETILDLQLVHKGDDFEFHKNSGSVNYKHDINNPFANDKEIIGCYCILKNTRGEFVELLNNSDIGKIRSTAKTQKIWNDWEGEMILKSVIKRICKRHFFDSFKNIEKIDNQNNTFEKTEVEIDVKTIIEEAKTTEELGFIYNEHKFTVENEQDFIIALSERRKEIENK